MNRRRSLALCLLSIAACATTGDTGEGDRNLPTAGVGPFRRLEAGEVRGLAPFVLDDVGVTYRDPAVLQLAGDETWLYAVARTADAAGVVVRTRARDERTFFGAGAVPGQTGKRPVTVLRPDLAWEGVALSGPAVVRRNAEVLLFYAARDGIGVARGTDGTSFEKEPGPVLTLDGAASWETSPPRAPSVFALPDARLRMLYASGVGIGEAESVDGRVWRRLGLVLGPAPAPAPNSLLPNERPPFDTASVGDPCAAPRSTPGGRFHVRVLYTGTDSAGATAIGFAARYGEDGSLTRQPSPVYSAAQGEAAPALLELGGRSVLYIQQDRRDATAALVTGIAAAVAPVAVRLGTPLDPPAAP
jgi:hypothetical protein